MGRRQRLSGVGIERGLMLPLKRRESPETRPAVENDDVLVVVATEDGHTVAEIFLA
jgi:hypothetical protein